MAYNPNWPRWVQASVGDHFKAVATANSYPSLLEEIDERTTEFMESSNRVEIRVNGPHVVEKSAGFWHFEVDVNILIHSYMGDVTPNAYLGMEITGKFAEAASQKIPIFKYGIGVDDDDSFIGCLTIRRGQRESVKVFHFGEIDREHRLRQFGVDANYEMEICP